MGIINILKGSFTGKVGELVGAKWKNKNTVRTYTKPAYTNTPAQQLVRARFGEMTSYIALFSDQIKSLSALNTKGMSVRNAIIRLNKEKITKESFDPAELLVSRGGLPPATGFSATIATGRTAITAAWTPAVGATISERARVVVIAVDADLNFAAVGSALNVTGTLEIPCQVPTSAVLNIHYYLIDYRGSSRVGSPSGYYNL